MAGLSPETDPASETRLLRRWPHLTRAAANPHNQIAATFAEQIARARQGRASEQLDHVQAAFGLMGADPTIYSRATSSSG